MFQRAVSAIRSAAVTAIAILLTYQQLLSFAGLYLSAGPAHSLSFFFPTTYSAAAASETPFRALFSYQ